jgi:hypothetical protein
MDQQTPENPGGIPTDFSAKNLDALAADIIVSLDRYQSALIMDSNRGETDAVGLLNKQFANVRLALQSGSLNCDQKNNAEDERFVEFLFLL